MKKFAFELGFNKAAMAFGVCLLLVCITADNISADTRGVSPTEIRIGIVPDLSGPSAEGVRKYIWALKRYFQEVNQEGGIYGREIKLFIQDGKYNPSIALSAFKKLVALSIGDLK